MKKRKVGVISLAIVLIGLGIIIFAAQVNKLSAVELAMKFWPAILFLLGGEILWYSYKGNKEDGNVKYDVFSILMIFVIVIVNLGIYGFIESGAMSKVNRMILNENYSFDISKDGVNVKDEIRKIVISGPGPYYNLNIRTDEGNKLFFSGSLNVRADSEKKAEEISKRDYIFTRESNNVLYISFVNNRYHNNETLSVEPVDLTLIIPEDREVEIRGGNSYEIVLGNIKKDWTIDKGESVKILLGKDSNVKINAYASDKTNLNGNAQWNITGENPKVKGELIRGQGNSNIYILNCNDISVDELK
ncbi:hypothetical protein EQM13_03875 [Acidilutibacter cellobiosedens]|uniref:DUF5668 domain-containing protein n=1 Tax=Acidilutibacter cellobiosedens TaxID=2507161 RepID=A0A410Q9Y8_9FIRM|nr:hypothetical protein [Acidilutibacter cellobiosedens]MBE6081588.1 hypothetical protein [Tissierellaceae bacterium]QAT60779.1 hypothetical protein EQM13_03875 [Acidilutibacter cellobiosedens]